MSALMFLWFAAAFAGIIPDKSQQILVIIPNDWDDSAATMQRMVEQNGQWVPVDAPIPVRLGRAGLAWGRGLHPAQPDGPQKMEGDWRAPAGVFTLGDAFGDALLVPAPRWPMRRVGPRDLWIEDATHPLYNQHQVVPPDRPLTDWEQSQRMRLGDAAHRLKVVVHHNAAPNTRAGAGSAIFLHIWRRDGAAPTAGCTAMPADALEAVIRWLRPEAHPLFVVLPRDAYITHQQSWGLPPLPTSPAE